MNSMNEVFIYVIHMNEIRHLLVIHPFVLSFLRLL